MDNELYSYINKAQIISFDIYDTLILRSCKHSYEVFEIIESFGYKQFKKKRLAAEKKARKLARREEVTLDEIYEHLDFSQKAKIKKEEKRIELEISQINNEMLEVYNYCITRKKDVIITSDMYLPEEIVSEILKKNGITGYRRLYLSSTLGLRKKTGRIFDLISRDFGISRKKILHIGDNHISDNMVPRRMGIMTYEYHPETDALQFCYLNKYKPGSLMKLRCVGENNPYYLIGYSCLGTLLLGFSIWLHKKIMESKMEKIVFLSRDGMVMKRAYELLFGENDDCLYLYGSRRSLIVPILWTNPDIEQVRKVIHFHDRMSIKEFLERVGLDSSCCRDELASFGFSENTRIDNWQLAGDDKVKKFYESIKPKVIEQSKREYAYAYEYWIDNLRGVSNIAIVDIGWNGNMQNALTTILGSLVNINGYYIGVNPKTQYSFPMEGFLFDKRGSDVIKNKIENFSGLFESFFMTNHGSVKRYIKNGVELLPYEYSTQKDRIVDEDQCIHVMQKGAFKYIYDAKKIIGDNDVQISSGESVANFLNLGLYPSLLTCELFGDFRFYNSEISYLARPKKNKFNLEELKQTNWRIGYLKRCFRVSLPYYNIAKVIKLFKKILR